MEREPDALPPDDEVDLFGDPDDVDASIEEELDERLEEERQRD
ncbi:MAG TPA: hypothetical protein VG474_02570 [Solirubrobacteraceae bacterium]|nr:hypothetical protein [Solirubrobacteraceae bacterium]